MMRMSAPQVVQTSDRDANRRASNRAQRSRAGEQAAGTVGVNVTRVGKPEASVTPDP